MLTLACVISFKFRMCYDTMSVVIRAFEKSTVEVLKLNFVLIFFLYKRFGKNNFIKNTFFKNNLNVYN